MRDVKTDKYKENYLGHSMMAPVGFAFSYTESADSIGGGRRTRISNGFHETRMTIVWKLGDSIASKRLGK